MNIHICPIQNIFCLKLILMLLRDAEKKILTCISTYTPIKLMTLEITPEVTEACSL